MMFCYNISLRYNSSRHFYVLTVCDPEICVVHTGFNLQVRNCQYLHIIIHKPLALAVHYHQFPVSLIENLIMPGMGPAEKNHRCILKTANTFKFITEISEFILNGMVCKCKVRVTFESYVYSHFLPLYARQKNIQFFILFMIMNLQINRGYELDTIYIENTTLLGH